MSERLDEIAPEAGAFYVMDRGYIDFERPYVFSLSAASSWSAMERNISSGVLQRCYSHDVDKSTGVRSDHTVVLTATTRSRSILLRCAAAAYVDPETNKRFRFLTNNLWPYPHLPHRPDLQVAKAGGTLSLANGSSSICGSRHFTA